MARPYPCPSLRRASDPGDAYRRRRRYLRASRGGAAHRDARLELRDFAPRTSDSSSDRRRLIVDVQRATCASARAFMLRPRDGAHARERFNSAHTRCDAAFRRDHEESDVAGC